MLHRQINRVVIVGSLIIGVLVTTLACNTAPAEDPTVDPGDPAPTQQVTATAIPTQVAPTAPTGPAGTVVVANGPLAGYPQMVDSGFGHTGDKAFLSQVFDFLFEATPDLELIPGLVTDWSVAADMVTWDFTLRDDVQFHNGEWLTAADVVLQAQRNRETPEAGGLWRNTVQEITETGDHSFQIVTIDPDPALLANLSRLAFTGFMVSPASLVSQHMDTPYREAIGTGPYRLTESRVGELHRLVALDPVSDWEHWRIAPHFEQIDIIPIAENSTRIALLSTGGADLIDLPLSLKRQAESVPNVRFISAQGVATAGMIMCCIGAPDNVWNDIRVREAMNLAVDWDSIIELIYAGEAQRVATYPFARLGDGFDQDLEPYPYDPDRARQLLADAGYPDGFETTVRLRPYGGVPDIVAMGEAIATMWEDIGVRSALQPVEGGVDSRLNREHDPEVQNTVRTTRATFFPVGIHGSIQCNLPDLGPGTQSGRHTCHDIDHNEYLQAKITVDPQERHRLAQEVNRWLHREYATVGAIEVNLIYAVGPRIADWQPLNGHTYLNRLEYLK